MISFEQSKSGVWMPRRQGSGLRSLFNRVGLGTLVNAMMVVIQLVTVWILWKTYQDTVIPNRQKELLAEQVAQLEIERKTIGSEIALAKKRAATFDQELGERRSELKAIASQRDRLLIEANQAQVHERMARAAEAQAISSAKTVKGQLANSQWSLYFQRAASIVNVPHLRMIAESSSCRLKGIGAEDTLGAFHTYLQGVERIWPNLASDADLVAEKLRTDDGNQYPRWMVEEFASYFQQEARKVVCHKPDFRAIHSSVDAQHKAATFEVLYKGLEAEERNLRAITDKCYDDFQAVGDGFFERKGIQQQLIPGAVREVFSDAREAREDAVR